MRESAVGGHSLDDTAVWLGIVVLCLRIAVLCLRALASRPAMASLRLPREGGRIIDVVIEGSSLTRGYKIARSA
jgi:hypothetical protein